MSRVVEVRGAVDTLFDWLDEPGSAPVEALTDGPAGTGKSVGAGFFVQAYLEAWPNCRVLAVRKTRASLTESWLKSWEEEVLGLSHPMVLGGPTRAGRENYRWPNGATLVCGGMDNATRHFSTEYDMIFAEECIEFTLSDWEQCNRALRNNRTPLQLLLGNTNPGRVNMWLDKRCKAGLVERLRSLHWHNPALWEGPPPKGKGFTEHFNEDTGRYELDLEPGWTAYGREYLGRRLNNLTGVRRDRLLHGRWVAASGVIWDEYDPAVHVIDPLPEESFKWNFGAVDWGFRPDPGVFQVWGLTHDGRMVLRAEVYRLAMQLDWWAGVAQELAHEFNLRAIVCDPSQPGSIQALNSKLGPLRGRDGKVLARKADNDVASGLDAVRWGFSSADGGPRTFITRNCLRHGRDQELADTDRPTCWEEEIQAYIYEEIAEDRPNKERPDPMCDDHGCDTARYGHKYVAFGRDLTPAPIPDTFKEGTIGETLGHQTVLKASKHWFPGM